jgi:transcriptional regulator with XRE-family HTH domain
MSLREAAERAGVSNPYLSLIERGERKAPHPNILKKLAAAYEIEFNKLMKIAGYLDTGEDEQDALLIDKEFFQALADPQFSFGHRLREDLDLETKRFIVKMYRKLRSQAQQSDG